MKAQGLLPSATVAPVQIFPFAPIPVDAAFAFCAIWLTPPKTPPAANAEAPAAAPIPPLIAPIAAPAIILSYLDIR
ncbi:hypothetical protein [Chryseobacterium gossypii]|uniref:hypothetical protein n=1 Tax=Chryseobacterium gossypii TaxID=3231602 RepID=UPI003523CAAA